LSRPWLCWSSALIAPSLNANLQMTGQRSILRPQYFTSLGRRGYMLLWSIALVATHFAKMLRWLMCKPFTVSFRTGQCQCLAIMTLDDDLGRPLEQAICIENHNEALNATCRCMLLYEFTCAVQLANRYTCWIYSREAYMHKCGNVLTLNSSLAVFPALQCAQYKQPKQPGPCECSA